MKKILVTGFLFLVVLSGQAQSLDNFERLKSEGPIPEDFLSTSTDESDNAYENSLDKNVDKESFLHERLFTKELLLSGKVVFNDPISEYIANIALHLLDNDFKTYNRLRFYTIKSSVTSAFATNQGIIFISTGLVSRLKNEAELAFVIAREIAHYKEKHIKEGFSKKKDLEKLIGKYKNKSYDEFLFNLNQYSKENELEADIKGAEIYYKAGYSKEGITGIFDILMRSHAPFENIELENTFFDAELLKIPSQYMTEEVPTILMDETKPEADSKRPNIITRNQNLAADSTLQAGNKLFHFTEKRFNEVRELSRFETVRQNLLEGDYVNAIYHAYCLKKLSKYKDSRFLDLSLVKAYYGIAKYYNAGYYDDLEENLATFEGEAHKLYYLIAKFDEPQINAFTLRHVYDISKNHEGDSTFQVYVNEMAKELILNETISVSSLRRESYDEYISNTENYIEFDVQDSIDRIYASELTDYEKLQLSKKVRLLGENKTKLDYGSYFYLFGFTDIIDDSLLTQSPHEFLRNDSLAYTIKDENYVIVDPKFENYNFREKDHLEAEASKAEFINYYTDDYDNLSLNRRLLDRKSLTATDVEAFNDLALINEWRNERVQSEIDMLPSSKDLMGSIESKYGSTNFLFSGIYAFRGRHKFNSTHLVMTSMIVFIPAVIYDLTVPHKYFEFIAFNINSETGKVNLILLEDVNLKAESKIIRHYIYRVLFKLSQGS